MTPRIAIAALLVAASVPASASVNLTGHFVGVIGSVLQFGPFPCESVDVTQSGTALSLTASCDVFGPQTFAASGTIDSATGAFTATGQGSVLCTTPGSLTLSAFGLADSYRFYGSLTCSFPDVFSASRCGNGILEGGESQLCDDAVAANPLAPPGCCSD